MDDRPQQPPPRTTENSSITQRHRIFLLVPEIREHREVSVGLFWNNDLPDEVYEACLYPLSVDEPYLRSAVDETFSASDVELLRNWFAEWAPDFQFSTEPAGQISDNQFGLGAMAVGGTTDFWMFDREGCPLSVWGYYDLRHANSGLYTHDPDAANLQIYFPADDESKPIFKRAPL